MRLVTNEPVIKRNAAIGRYASLAGLAILVSGLVFNFIAPPGATPNLPWPPVNALLSRPEAQYVPLVTLLVGFLLSNLGIMYSNRWVRPPRPDEALDAALKGLDDRHVLYHYRMPAAHVLVAPSGVYALLPKRQGGTITFEGGKWRQTGQNRFLSFFGQEGLGNPVVELAAEVSALEKFLGKNLPDVEMPVKGVIVFTNTAATVEADDAPAPALHTKKLKDYIRRQPKGPTLAGAALKQLNEQIGVDGAAAEEK
jgi:hypothetical protein